jgi:hypothetical protein
MATDPAPPPLSVVLKHQEVMAAAIASSSRVKGGGTWFTLALFAALYVAIWLGGPLAFWGVQQLPFELMFAIGPWLPGLVTTALCLVAVKLALDFEQRRAEHVYLRRLAAIGSPLERAATYEVTPDALVLTTERMVLAPRWHAIDTVERGADGWVLSADQLHFLIPFAAFAAEDAQRPLLAAITARMTPEARARSREAVEFAEAAPSTDVSATQPPPAAAPAAGADVPHSEAPEAHGWLTQEQAGWASSVIYGRVAQIGFHRWAYPLTGAVTGFLIGVVLVGLIAVLMPSAILARAPMAVFLGGVFIMLLGAAYGLGVAYQRLTIVSAKAWAAGLDHRGVPLQMEATWRLTDTGVAYRTARFSGEAAYVSVHQVLHEHGYWIIGVDTLTLVIPDTAFAATAHAQAFMARLLSRITEPARARSVTLEAASAS